MKLQDLARPTWGALAVTAVAGTAAGFVTGYIAGRDPELARRLAGHATSWLAHRSEHAALWMSQLRESLADAWAEARAASVDAVDASDFARHAGAASGGVAATSRQAPHHAGAGGAGKNPRVPKNESTPEPDGNGPQRKTKPGARRTKVHTAASPVEVPTDIGKGDSDGTGAEAARSPGAKRRRRPVARR